MESWSAAVDAAVELTVSVDVTVPVPVIAPGCVAEQVGRSVAPGGLDVTAQAMATVPVNPPLGVTEMAEVPLPPADAMLMAEPLSAKFGITGAVFTVSATVVVVDKVPDVPVTVAV
jgi:hypothetical protein